MKLSLSQLIDFDKKHLIHPVVNPAQHERNGSMVWQSADRVFLKDTHGHEVLDGFSGLWCVNVGYGHESIVQAATEQMRRLPYATGYFGFGCEPTIRLAQRLTAIAPPGLSRVFFTQGGSDAVDTAIRLTRYFYNVTGRPNKKHFIAMQRGYHGSSTEGSGLTALPVFHTNFDLPLPTQHHVSAPYSYRHPAGPDEAAVLQAFVTELEQKIESLGKDNVAAFICEPVIGSGGVIFPPKGFLKAVRKVCDDYRILMIADEVITGFGRTGPIFACVGEGVTPDIMTLAKGLTSGYAPLGATLFNEELYRSIANGVPDGSPLGHGQTYSGHPLSAAVANAVLDLYFEGGVLANSQKVAPYFESRLRELASHRLVGEVRVRGFLGAIELVVDKATKQKPAKELALAQRILSCALRHGLVFRAFADDILGFAPPLIFTHADVDMLIARLTTAIDEAAAEVSL